MGRIRVISGSCVRPRRLRVRCGGYWGAANILGLTTISTSCPRANEEALQSFHKVTAELPCMHGRDVGLIHPHGLYGVVWVRPRLADDRGDFRHQAGLDQMLLRIGQVEVRQHVAGTGDFLKSSADADSPPVK